MLSAIGLTAGEAFVVVFLTFFIVTAHYWPKVGAWLMVTLSAPRARSHENPEK